MTATKTKLTKKQRIERAKKASAAGHSIDADVRRIVRRAPELKPEHVDALRALLPPVPADQNKAGDG